MKQLVVGLLIGFFSLTTRVGAFESTSGLDQKITTTTQTIIQLVETKTTSFLQFVMNVLDFYEARFDTTGNERGAYIIEKLTEGLENYFETNVLDDTGVVIIPEDACGKAGGIWIDQFDECEGLDGTTCSELGGTFNECASACRHEPEGTVCTMQCVQVCSFSDEDVQIDMTQCESYYDGCNTCSVNSDGEIAGCTKKYCIQHETPACLQRRQLSGAALKNCISYYDGCNTCGVENGEVTMCTEMRCETPKQPKCLQYKQMDY